MIKQFLSSIGIGHVKVDTIVHKTEISPGDFIEGEVVLVGGMSDQPVNEVYLLLLEKYEEDKEDSDFPYHEKDVDTIILNDIGTIRAGEEKRIPFSFPTSSEHPKTTETNKTILRTTVDIPQAVDPTDEDSIFVR
ncbi:sporulation protein (plasmid) [Cytobacillus spongiae]|uniref:sporulation protein n=1 Tax=Cytobacillus spongiae TaxID=2901381 RepID=UPI00145DF815|nr:sporulation protein [Cytobacillus spongiae]MCA1062870.1 sporulation protein [Rossellomorea aquimaris]NMH70203.1 sporulation protein [Bacillus sp. RO3]UII58476.1 sporulation protein [Cytobacillus spongiae]WJV28500.1 sporulation protein [Rossellomorea sp. AcN35-11]